MTAQTAATIAQDLVEEFDEEQPATVVSLAAETLGRDLLQALLQEVRVLPDVWPKLTEKKQADVIDRLRSTVERTVKYAVKLISAGERPAIGGITVLVLRKDEITPGWLQSRFALSTDESLAVALKLLDDGVITLATEGESPDLNTYRVAVATKAPAEEPITLE
ncbi:hypothetical protein [Pseudomonas aeruginosa]|uniref:hypothetical protein n=1 Tax=Pseudomonas aeruginosa TaxID=287 RepID=UPI0009374C7C|nr:hypothetical protein [Pseudomonas aeruginosa]